MPAPSTWRGPVAARRPRKWLPLLRQAVWVVASVMLLWALLSLLDKAEGDLRQVQAPTSGATVC